MSDWSGIEEFIAVVEAGGFTAAAERHPASVAHISRAVSQLEKRLGVKLLQRSTRVVRLTEAGNAYFQRVRRVVDQLAEVNQEASGISERMAGPIRLTCGGRYAEDHVAPALAAFLLQYPQIKLTVDISSRYVDLVAEGFDMAVRYGHLPDSNLIARRLSYFPSVCAATPEYWAQYGKPTTPADLMGHNCLRVGKDPWRFYVDGEPVNLDVAGTWRSNSGGVAITTALSGLGVAYLPRIILQPYIEAGQLIPVLEHSSDDTRSAWMVYPDRDYVPVRVLRLMDWLADWFGNPK